MPLTVQREDFIVWRDQLEELLEQTPGWSGVGQALAKVRERNVEATLETTGSTAEQSRDLYTLLKMKLNANAYALCSDVEDRNGIEIYCRLSAECDPQAEGTDMALLDQLMGMAHHQCKNFDDTYHAVKKFKRLWTSTALSQRSILSGRGRKFG